MKAFLTSFMSWRFLSSRKTQLQNLIAGGRTFIPRTSSVQGHNRHLFKNIYILSPTINISISISISLKEHKKFAFLMHTLLWRVWSNLKKMLYWMIMLKEITNRNIPQNKNYIFCKETFSPNWDMWSHRNDNHATFKGKIKKNI